MFGLGAPELLIILVILLLLFGGAKLPQLSRSIGQSMKELRRGVEDGLSEPDQPIKSKTQDQQEHGPKDSPPPVI